MASGDRVRVTRYWLRGTQYAFVADDGTAVPLHPFRKFWCVASTGGS